METFFFFFVDSLVALVLIHGDLGPYCEFSARCTPGANGDAEYEGSRRYKSEQFASETTEPTSTNDDSNDRKLQIFFFPARRIGNWELRLFCGYPPQDDALGIGRIS